jgi:hypothetical protein
MRPLKVDAEGRMLNAEEVMVCSAFSIHPSALGLRV